jgi:ABC-type transport system involved in cytochrome bd biosynthesis fused ATPase/permease subunit
MRTKHLTSLALVLGTFLLIPAALWSDDKAENADQKQKNQAAAPKNQLTEKVKADAEVWQKSRMPLLEHKYKHYESHLREKVRDKPSHQANRKFFLSHYEKEFCELFNEIISYDTDSKYADEAWEWMEKFIVLRKKARTN